MSNGFGPVIGPLVKTPSVNSACRLDVLGITADQAAANIVTPDVSGMVRVSFYMVLTGPLQSPFDQFPTITLGYADETGANTYALTAEPTVSGSGPGANANQTVCLWIEAGTPLTYTISGGGYGSGDLVFSLHIVVETL